MSGTSPVAPQPAVQPAAEPVPGPGAGGSGSGGSGSGGSGADGPGADGSDTGGRSAPLLVESIGGWRGLVDSGLPVVVFVAANTVAGLAAAVWSAIGCGVLLLALRLVRRESVQQTV